MSNMQKKKLWQWGIDALVWGLCIFALVVVLLKTRGPLEYLRPNPYVDVDSVDCMVENLEQGD